MLSERIVASFWFPSPLLDPTPTDPLSQPLEALAQRVGARDLCSLAVPQSNQEPCAEQQLPSPNASLHHFAEKKDPMFGGINVHFSASQVLIECRWTVARALSQPDCGASRQCEPRRGGEPAGTVKHGEVRKVSSHDSVSTSCNLILVEGQAEGCVSQRVG